MEWLLGGPSVGWLVDDPERYFNDEELAAPPPPPPSPMYYYLRHGYGPGLPSSTPSDEDQEHFAPPGYAPTTEFFQPPTAVHVDMPLPGLAINPLEMEEENDVAAAAHVVPALPDLNLPALDEEKAEDTVPSAALPMPSPEAARARVVPALPDLNLQALDEKGKAKDTAPSAALSTPSSEARLLLRRFTAAMAARPAGLRAGTWSPVKLSLTDPEGVLRLDEPFTGTSRP
jgi:hypothetical protein